jgi:hypothetical protein
MLSWRYEVLGTGEIFDALGEHPQGYIRRHDIRSGGEKQRWYGRPPERECGQHKANADA